MKLDELKALGLGEQWLDPLNETFDKYQINTPKRQACFLGQTLHESGNFKFTRENLYYSARALMNTWPSRFPSLEIASQYERQPEKIASKVYVGRLGNESPEEAAKFIGRGLIQVTGKENYKHCGDALSIDLIDSPHLLEEPRYAVLSAGWFWGKRGLNLLADSMDIETMTKRINGGLIGLDDRKKKINQTLAVLS